MDFQQIRDFVNPAVGQATGIEPVENLAMPVPTAHLMQAGGGGSITIDSELSETSTNPVENRVITAALRNSAGVIVTYNLSTETLDKQFSELQTSIDNGEILKLMVVDEYLGTETKRIFECGGFSTLYDEDDPEAVPINVIVFYNISFIFRSNKIHYVIYMIHPDNTVEQTSREVTMTTPH